MNKILIIFLFLLTTINCYSTEQIPDLLIIENDTIYLKSFPLEKLEFKKSLFSYGEFSFPLTGCWRGYRAKWKIIASKLALIEVEKVDSTKQKLDIIDYLNQNGYAPKFIDGYVFAEWYSSKLLLYSIPGYLSYPGLYLEEEYPWTKNNGNVQLVFKNGILEENKIIGFETYKIGDNISFNFSHYPPGLIKKKSLELKGSITALRNNLVLVKIYSYDTGKKKEIDQIRRFIGNMAETDTLLINPLYWKKEE